MTPENISIVDNTVTIEGDMDALSVKSLRSAFDELAEEERGDLILDISQVPFIDSSGIGALVFLFKRLTAKGRKMEIRGVTDQPRQLFMYLRIDKTIKVTYATSAGNAASPYYQQSNSAAAS